MSDLIDFLSKLDIGTILALAAMLWFFKSHLDKKFEKIDNRFEKVTEEFREEFKDIRIDIKELRTSLNRMEGAFYSKECCMLKDDKDLKKAE